MGNERNTLLIQRSRTIQNNRLNEAIFVPRLQFVFALIFAMTCGCKVGPNFSRPPVGINDHWTAANAPLLRGEPVCIASWWEDFHDPVLRDLVVAARSQNLGLAEAGHRVQEARFRRQIAAGNLFPQLQSLDGAYSRSKLSKNNANFFSVPSIFEPDLRPDNWQLGMQAAWELDFWGRYRRLIEAADAHVGEVEAIYHDAMVLLISEVAIAYVDLRTLECRINLAKQNLAIQSRTLELAKEKREAGLASALDVAQATTIYGQTASILPLLEIQRRQASHRLCALLGRTPADLAWEIQPTGQIPQPPPGMAFGIPADLLRRRPDLRKAEMQLAGQSAKIGVASSEFYPHISLRGSLGYSAEDVGNLFQRGSSVAILSPNFAWNILNYGRIKNLVNAEQEAFLSMACHYQQVVLEAQREVEDAQIAYILGFDRIQALYTATQGAQMAVEKAESAYAEGIIDYGRVYVLQSELLKQQDQLVLAESDVVKSLIGIFKSLGGGWENSVVNVDVPSAINLCTSCSSEPTNHALQLPSRNDCIPLPNPSQELVQLPSVLQQLPPLQTEL